MKPAATKPPAWSVLGRRKPWRWTLPGAGVFGIAATVLACGPWLPEQILISKQVILRTPVGDFAQEVMGLTEDDGAPGLPAGMVRAVPTPQTEDAVDTTQPAPGPFDGETAELRDALRYYQVRAERWDNLVVAYKAFRTELASRTASLRQPKDDNADTGFRFDERAQTLRQAPPAPKPPVALPPTLAEGLPAEWADYLQGAFCFWSDDLPGARAAWERLLARPQAQRLYCSTRAAYMLARTADEPGAPPEENARRYQRVRQLRAEGCRDLFNLASKSCGWEGRVAYGRHDDAAAIRLYYLQAVSSGGDFDLISTSLRRVTADALGQADADPVVMTATVHDPFLRRVVTLYLACHRAYQDDEPPSADATLQAAASPATGTREPTPAESERRWLAALTQAGINVVREAAPVAWTAYQQADYASATEWLAKAPADDGLALWLRAKLALRAGKENDAAAFFARAVRCYPAEVKAVSNPMDNASGLAADGAAFRTCQFQADLGIISLARNDYAQALSALLRSGFWRDAAYVAERVMTPDELRAYVRANFPQAPALAPTPTPTPAFDAEAAGTPTPTQVLQSRVDLELSTNPAVYALRYLLGRRLARDGRYAEAREYFPAPLRPKFDEYVAARKLGDADRQPKTRRADALWRAAKIERWLGMELFGSEDDPDWFVEDGDFDDDHYREARLGRPQVDEVRAVNASSGDPAPTPKPPYLPPVSNEEKQRVDKDQIHPEKRFHYRYLAADLAWQAASLMADQQEQTARVLAAGGLWLENMNEYKAADKFYLAILRRCGQTDTGRATAKAGAIPGVPHEEP